jgi:uncharacterized membrane protein
MHKGRVEAFSDGVFAIIITIMVLELKVPHGAEWHDLITLWPVFLSYVLSFINVGIYWNNHHHMFQAVKAVTGGVLWANLFLLFWLSLMPFSTAWMGENHFDTIPVAVYGFDLFMCGVAYYILSHALLRCHPADSAFAAAIGNDRKGTFSAVAYGVSVPLAFFVPLLSFAIFIFVALVWLIPDRRFETRLSK